MIEYLRAWILRPGKWVSLGCLGLIAGCAGRMDPVWREAPDPTCSLRAAQLRLASGDLDGAQETCQEVLQKEPDNYWALLLLGQVHLAAGRSEPAIYELKRAGRSDPNAAMPHYWLGRLYRSQGKWDQAVAAFRAALRRQPQETDLHFELLRTYHQQGRLDQAVAVTQNVLKQQPENPETYRYLGMIRYQQKRYQEAIQSYQSAVNRAKDVALHWFNLAVAQQTQGQKYAAGDDSLAAKRLYEEAEKSYRQALRCDSGMGAVYNNLALLLVEQDRLLEAVNLSNEAVQRLPGNAEVLDTAGWIYWKGGGQLEALWYLERAAAISSRNPNPSLLYHLGVVYAELPKKLHKTEEARQVLQRAIQSDPDFPEAAEARRLLARLQRRK